MVHEGCSDVGSFVSMRLTGVWQDDDVVDRPASLPLIPMAGGIRRQRHRIVREAGRGHQTRRERNKKKRPYCSRLGSLSAPPPSSTALSLAGSLAQHIQSHTTSVHKADTPQVSSLPPAMSAPPAPLPHPPPEDLEVAGGGVAFEDAEKLIRQWDATPELLVFKGPEEDVAGYLDAVDVAVDPLLSGVGATTKAEAAGVVVQLAMASMEEELRHLMQILPLKYEGSTVLPKNRKGNTIVFKEWLLNRLPGSAGSYEFSTKLEEVAAGGGGSGDGEPLETEKTTGWGHLVATTLWRKRAGRWGGKGRRLAGEDLAGAVGVFRLAGEAGRPCGGAVVAQEHKLRPRALGVVIFVRDGEYKVCRKAPCRWVNYTSIPNAKKNSKINKRGNPHLHIIYKNNSQIYASIDDENDESMASYRMEILGANPNGASCIWRSKQASMPTVNTSTATERSIIGDEEEGYRSRGWVTGEKAWSGQHHLPRVRLKGKPHTRRNFVMPLAQSAKGEPKGYW
uniref:Uncharacterized protein n=1 Tax=Oryza glumipatula TaxID=40148 RepID=A0A0D9Z7L9_9ORYZ